MIAAMIYPYMANANAVVRRCRAVFRRASTRAACHVLDLFKALSSKLVGLVISVGLGRGLCRWLSLKMVPTLATAASLIAHMHPIGLLAWSAGLRGVLVCDSGAPFLTR